RVVLRGFSAAVDKITFSRDGKRLLSASARVLKRAVEERKGQQVVVTYVGADLRLWDATTDSGTVAVGETGDAGTDVAFSADGKRSFSFKGHKRQLEQVAFHPDSKRIASAEFGGPVKVWDPATGGVLLTLEAARWPLAWSPDGKTLVTSDSYNHVLLWHADSG